MCCGSAISVLGSPESLLFTRGLCSWLAPVSCSFFFFFVLLLFSVAHSSCPFYVLLGYALLLTVDSLSPCLTALLFSMLYTCLLPLYRRCPCFLFSNSNFGYCTLFRALIELRHCTLPSPLKHFSVVDHLVAKKILSPPIMACMAGLVIGLSPPLRWLLVREGAPLGPMWAAFSNLVRKQVRGKSDHAQVAELNLMPDRYGGTHV